MTAARVGEQSLPNALSRTIAELREVCDNSVGSHSEFKQYLLPKINVKGI